MTQLTGRVFITINGQRMRSKDGASLDIGGVSRAAGMSDSGVDGYVETTAAPKVDFAINHSATISLTDIHDMTDATLVFETDSGVVFTIREAFSTTPPKLSKGDVQCSFEGVECIEG
ncbi:phage tail tube protein [Pseudacidovorax intermedius]|uniref:phage tail tube protein n=1 Tax=Pseudacidovorax intermedius TaxID=433924 RepID=UPI0026EC3637|nr:phage tail tube protein [Pseudacidovorax intermedius]